MILEKGEEGKNRVKRVEVIIVRLLSLKTTATTTHIYIGETFIRGLVLILNRNFVRYFSDLWDEIKVLLSFHSGRCHDNLHILSRVIKSRPRRCKSDFPNSVSLRPMYLGGNMTSRLHT